VERLALDGGVQTLRVMAKDRPRIFSHAGMTVNLKPPPTRQVMYMRFPASLG